MTTAAASVPSDRQVASSPSSTLVSSRPQSPNYLQRLVQDLDPKVAAHHEFCKRAFEVALIVYVLIVPVLLLIVPVLFVLAAGSSVVLGLFPVAPLLAIPLVAIGLGIAGGLTTKGIVNFFETCKEEHANKERFLTDISEKLQSLPDDARVIRHQLTSMRVPGAENLDNPTRFRPLIAYHDYWTEKQTTNANIASSFLSEAHRLDAEALAAQEEGNKSSLQKQADNLRLRALEFLDKAVTAKVNAAFIHAVIQRPEFAGTFDDLATISSRSSLERDSAQQVNDPAAQQFLVFKNRDIQPITRGELSNHTTMPVRLIAERFVQAMTPAAN